jgi:SAM-dependent methyltransferase
MDDHLLTIRKAYDRTVDLHDNNIDPLYDVPEEFRNSQEFQEFVDSCKTCNSAAPDILQFLSPSPMMRFLDIGCCANLINYKLYQWPSEYYGIDISPKLIMAMRNYIADNNIKIGKLWIADTSDMPFCDDYFDISAAIGVFEYCTLEYCERAIPEISRVLKPQAKLVLDLPNPEHKHVEIMYQLEEHLGRPNIPKNRADFEDLLTKKFKVFSIDDSQVMIKYYCENT